MPRSAFLNQRPRFRNLSPPYAAKTLINPRGYFPSRKNGRQIAFWDLRELNFIMLAEASPDVLSFEERPELIRMRVGPTWYSYTPHFCVALPTGMVFVELSHTAAPTTPGQQTIAVLARSKFQADGHRFAELSHKAIRTEPAYTNALMLLRHASIEFTSDETLQVRDVLTHGPAEIGDVVAATGVSRGRLLAMALRGDLHIKTDELISLRTKIGLPGSGAGQ